jgi:hypothetical protein
VISGAKGGEARAGSEQHFSAPFRIGERLQEAFKRLFLGSNNGLNWLW